MKLTACGNEYDFWLFENARSLSPEEVLTLELKREAEPDNLTVVVSLLGYYWASPTPENEPKWFNLLYWLIRNRPRAWLASHCPTHNCCTNAHREIFADAWRLAVVENTNDGQVCGNAGLFFSNINQEYSIELLKKAQVFSSNNPEWPTELFRILTARTDDLTDDRDIEIDEALSYADAALLAEKDSGPRFELLKMAGSFSVKHNRISKARSYATRLERIAKDAPFDYWKVESWNLSGRVALRRGKLKTALNYLDKCRRVETVEDFSLVQDLFHQGHIDEVVAYLNSVLTQIENPSEIETVKQWIIQIERHETPDFSI